ncbi:hypothetical protein BDW62DRAFT_183530 [Aspergillus aurantiobrunneus]
MASKLINRISPAPDLDQSVSSAKLALSPPPPHSTNPSGIRESSLLSAPLQSPFPSPGVSTRSAAGSPGRPTSPGNRSGAPNQPSTLPLLPKHRGVLDSSTTSPEDKKAESSVYYTTAWGSPYAAPSPRTYSWSLSQDAGVDRDSGDSSPVSIQFGLEPNRPFILHGPDPPEGPIKEPGDGNLDRSPERGRVTRRGKSIQDFTQDWINQYLSGQTRTERSNWLSDDSGSEAPSFITAQNHFADDASDDWLGLEHDSRDQDLLKTPTLADFVSRRAANSRREGGAIRSKIKESLHKRADTLRQEDFWGFAYDKDPQPITMVDTQEVQPPTEMEHKPPSPEEKPLPPPPADEKGPSSTTETLGNSAEADKKIPWRGKGCIIELPLYDKRGTEESGYRLLTAEDVKQGLKQWEELGYDVRGFNVGATEDPTNLELGGASRPPYPEAADMQDGLEPGNYKVSFPNKQRWDEYVNQLQEEKLRALGVFGGDDEPQPSVSPPSALNSITPFPGLVSSPPIPTASAASNSLQLHHPFSPQLAQGGNMNSGIPSLASPASQFGVQTPFYGVDQGMIPGFLPFQPTPPAQGSLTPQSFINLRQSGPTSTIPGNLSSLTSMLSPVSPLNDQNAFHPGLGEHTGQPKDAFDVHMDQHTQDEYGEDQLRPLRTPPPNPDNFHASTVEIAQPTPRGHSRGHNLSETLQKGIDQVAPDYHLEGSIERELDNDDFDPMQHNLGEPGLLKSRWALPETNAPQNVAQHLNHFYGDGYSGEVGHEGSDIDTNPSLSGTPRRNGPLGHHIPWHESKPSNGSYAGGHRSKLSTSSLNVEAKEFAPTGQAPPPQMPFPQQNSFQFPRQNSVFTFGAGSNEQPSGRLNVAAPSFTPGRANTTFDASQDAKSREFKFSAPSAPSFNVAAPEFSPGRTKIFGDIDISRIADSANTKSKAIPIVRPDEAKENEQDNKESKEGKDDRGRPIPTDRHKRARRGVDSSNGEEARFSISKPLTDATNIQASQPSDASHVPAEGKENALPGQDRDLPLDTKAPVAQNENPIERKDTPVSEASTWAPSETKARYTVVSPDTTEPNELQHKGTEEPVEHKPEPEMPQQKPTEKTEQDKVCEKPKPAEKPRPAESGLRSILSAAARPFNFKPSIAEFVPFDTPKETKGLMSSRYALSTELTASADVDDKEDLPKDTPHEAEEIQKHGEEDQDSLDEDQLNAIMDQLNDDSDVGIERTSTPQPPSNVPEPVVAPSKEKRHVQADNRSEPPSPSPGRGAVSHTLNFSATPTKVVASGMQSPVRRLMSRNEHIKDVKLANRSRFFDRRINELLGAAIDERLNPLENALSSIQQSILALNSAPHDTLALKSASAEDDDYEEDASYRARSPLHQREPLATREAQPAPEQPAMAELQELRNRDTTAGLREMMQEVVASQINLRSRSDAEEIGADNMLRGADERTENEYKKRRQAQDTIAQLQRLLKDVEEDAARHSTAAESAEARLLQFQEEKMPYYQNIQQRATMLEKERESTMLTLDELSSKNIALQGTLDEHRFAADSAKRETEEANARLDEMRIEDGLNIRHNLSEKLDNLQDQMASLTGEEEEMNARYNELRASHNRETKLREQLEIDFIFGQSQQENERLEELAAHFEREFNEARESSRSDLDAANTQVNIVRAELEAQIVRLQTQVDNRYEMLLEEANETKATAVASARKLHERVLNDLREHRARTESHLTERLKFSDEKVNHLQERSAARAAAEAAQSSPSMQLNQGSSVPEKISPQALRESILVLQDQLQQRETRIDELEHEIKEKDTEITWLRELLGPSFNQHSQQEKERAMNGQSFPNIPSLSELTASPRALPLAAAAAWGNWRKGRENSNTNASDQTPSNSNARQVGPNTKSRPLKSYDTTSRPLSSRAGKMREPPTTPPLLRKSSYDHDAEPADYAQSCLEEENESTADGFVSASPKELTDGPFGPQIA